MKKERKKLKKHKIGEQHLKIQFLPRALLKYQEEDNNQTDWSHRQVLYI